MIIDGNNKREQVVKLGNKLIQSTDTYDKDNFFTMVHFPARRHKGQHKLIAQNV